MSLDRFRSLIGKPGQSNEKWNLLAVFLTYFILVWNYYHLKNRVTCMDWFSGVEDPKLVLELQVRWGISNTKTPGSFGFGNSHLVNLSSPFNNKFIRYALLLITSAWLWYWLLLAFVCQQIIWPHLFGSASASIVVSGLGSSLAVSAWLDPSFCFCILWSSSRWLQDVLGIHRMFFKRSLGRLVPTARSFGSQLVSLI